MSSFAFLKATQAFFFFVGLPLPEENWEAWANDDEFKGKPHLDKSKSYLFDELMTAKKDLFNFLDSNEKMNQTISKTGGARVVDQYLRMHIIRIKKIRLIIEFTVYYSRQKNAYGQEYLIAKSCWVSNKNGKVHKKFSKLVGSFDLIKENDKRKAVKELEALMWNEYQKEYK
ncbi:hypothetical protein [Aquirufa antheringensis]|uniref:hypothetical protein n=1 Tax=Aquirufa antheringensis TaxID=2516559 RepID=UPI0022A89A95|nr:hypothetical protein [Aquirufa antheringensis]MCZ2488323.1 hypothetical protein [Aquirufa antheringensis]